MASLDRVNQAIRPKRLVRVPMELELIRAMDQTILSGAGGYSSREEFIGDAVHDKVLELTHVAEDAERIDGDLAIGSPATLEPLNFADTAISFRDGYLVQDDEAQLEVPSGPLLGLHNRDYPSIWALSQLAELLAEQPDGDAEAQVMEVVRRAWDYTARLRLLEHESGRKLTQLFPANRAKEQTATGVFRQFAIGRVRLTDGSVRADGPLFTWRALSARTKGDRIFLALTTPGHQLLTSLDGLNLETPHESAQAERFLAHLGDYAPADLAGLRIAARAAQAGSTRPELVERFAEQYPTFSEAQAASCAQGYVARCREWGLVEPKLIEGSYVLTEIGARLLAAGALGEDLPTIRTTA